LHSNYKERLEELAPHAPTSQYLHNRTGDACPEATRGDNANAQPKRNATRCELHIMDREVVLAVTTVRLGFGPREQIFDGEFVDRRQRRAWVKIIGEGASRPSCIL
jgi:thiamine phosphate synthase YjbQ (UPF0047 family)